MNGFKLARIKANLSLKNAVDLLGISKSFLIKIERSEKSPSMQTLINMSKVYNCTIDSFFLTNNNTKSVV